MPNVPILFSKVDIVRRSPPEPNFLFLRTRGNAKKTLYCLKKRHIKEANHPIKDLMVKSFVLVDRNGIYC